MVLSMHQAGPLYPPIADVSLRGSEPPLRASFGPPDRSKVGNLALASGGI
jgi:hypothetical protein